MGSFDSLQAGADENGVLFLDVEQRNGRPGPGPDEDQPYGFDSTASIFFVRTGPGYLALRNVCVGS